MSNESFHVIEILKILVSQTATLAMYQDTLRAFNERVVEVEVRISALEKVRETQEKG